MAFHIHQWGAGKYAELYGPRGGRLTNQQRSMHVESERAVGKKGSWDPGRGRWRLSLVISR